MDQDPCGAEALTSGVVDLSAVLVDSAQVEICGPDHSAPGQKDALLGLPPGDGPDVELGVPMLDLRGDVLSKPDLASGGPLVRPTSNVVNLTKRASSGGMELMEEASEVRIMESTCAPRPDGPTEDLFLGVPGGI